MLRLFLLGTRRISQALATALILLVCHLLAGVAELVKAAEGRLHGLVALRLSVESQLEERLEQNVLQVLRLLPAEGQFNFFEVLLV